MNSDDEIVVFRTGSLIQLDSVTGALKDAGIPHFTRGETSGGLSTAMPGFPVEGPGSWWKVIVPAPAAADAKSVIATMPFAEKANPGVWDCQPPPKVQLGWKIYIGGILLLLLIGTLCALILKVM